MLAEDELALVPGDRQVRVRGLQVHGTKRGEAITGQRTAVNLGGIEVAEIRRGQSLATPGTLSMTRRADALLDLLPTAKPLRHGARVHVHQGTSELLGRVSLAGAATTEVTPGARAAVRIRLEDVAALTRGDRFIIRAYSPAVTIGGGEVLDPDPPRAGIRSAASGARFAALAADRLTAIARIVTDAGGEGLPTAALVSRAGVAPAEAASVASALVDGGHARLTADRLVAPAVVAILSKRLLQLAGDFHRAQPLVDGIPREEARERVFARAHPAVFDLVLGELAAANRLIVRDRLALPGHRLELSPDESHTRTVVEAAYKRAGLRPPDSASIATEGKLTAPVVEKMTALLLRQKRLARVDTLIFHVETLNQLKAEIQALKGNASDGRATVDVATFKDRYGVTRKFAIPLLEWLDRERVTRRIGETRVVL